MLRKGPLLQLRWGWAGVWHGFQARSRRLPSCSVHTSRTHCDPTSGMGKLRRAEVNVCSPVLGAQKLPMAGSRLGQGPFSVTPPLVGPGLLGWRLLSGIHSALTCPCPLS